MRFPLWIFWGAVGVDLLQQESHVVGHGTHGLQSLGIKSSLALGATVNNVPVLRSNHRHIEHLKRHEKGLVNSLGAATATHGHCSGRLVLHHMRSGIGKALNKAQHSAVWLPVIGGRPHNESIGLSHLVDDSIA